MRRPINRCAAVLCGWGVASLSGCAMMGSMRPAADSYTYDVGVASEPEMRARTSTQLRTLGYQLIRDEGVHIETGWQKRSPVDARERALRTEIISRVTINGSRYVAAGPQSTYHVIVTVESRFVPTQGTRRDARATAASISYAESVVKGMSLALGGTARPVADEPRPF